MAFQGSRKGREQSEREQGETQNRKGPLMCRQQTQPGPKPRFEPLPASVSSVVTGEVGFVQRALNT